MENLSSLILEISSDEETGFGDASKSGFCGGGGEFVEREDHNWLSELLGEVERSKDDDSDDVIIVGEVFQRPPKKSRLLTSPPSLKVVESDSGGDDDECVVLEEDPEKALVVVNGSADNEDDDSDGVEIVGEKGEVACRDFPHARHLCAKYPFASTRHDVHCYQCHCYVCDSLAPCAHWGTGTSSIDHCHASDKEEYWKTERKNLKEGYKKLPVPPVTNNTPFFAGISETNQGPRVAPPQPNSLLHYPGFRPVMIRPCLMSSNASVPNVANQGRVYRPRCNFPRYGPQLQSVSPQSVSTFSRNLLSGNKSHNAGNKGHHLCPSRPVFKRTGYIGASQDNHGYVGSQLSGIPSRRRHQALQTLVLNSSHGANRQEVPGHSVFAQPDSSGPRSIGVGRSNLIQSQHQNHSLMLTNRLVKDPASIRPQMASQPYLRNNLVNTIPLQTPLSSQSNVGNFDNTILSQYNSFNKPYWPLPSQVTASVEPDVGIAFGYEQHSRSVVSNVCNTSENQSYQPYNPNSVTQNDLLQENQTLSSLDTHQEDFGLEWDALGRRNPQVPSGNSVFQSIAPSDGSPCQRVTEDDHHQNVPADNSTSLITKPDSLDFDRWMLEAETLPGVFEVPMSPYWNEFSPEHVSIDVSTLFDI